MSARSLWKVSVRTTAEAEEAVTELLQKVLGQPASSYTDVETEETTVAVYFTRKISWPKARVALLTGLNQIKKCELNIGAGKISFQKLRRQDWAESWKRHFKPLEIGSALLIKPSWNKRRPRKKQAVVVLDPGLSFGTGQHPTTSFCLRQLANLRPRRQIVESPHSQLSTPNSQLSFLDIGTGSGILAIAAAKLAYTPVDAFDFDPEAVRIARENAQKNGVANRVRVIRSDITRLPQRSTKKYDLVCANLISTLLMAEHRRILSRLKAGGMLVIAGILKSEFAEVQNVYESASLRLIASRTEKEWRSGAFRFIH